MTTETHDLTCREVSDFLGAYTAGELGARERALFDEHPDRSPRGRGAQHHSLRLVGVLEGVRQEVRRDAGGELGVARHPRQVSRP